MGERPAPRPGKDPLFTDEDAVEILDYLADERLICTGCGLPKMLTYDPANEFMFRSTVVACHACAANKRALRKLDDTDGAYPFAEFLG